MSRSGPSRLAWAGLGPPRAGGEGLVNWVSLAVFGEYAQELQKIRLQRNSCAESLSKVFGLYLKDKEDGTVLCVK